IVSASTPGGGPSGTAIVVVPCPLALQVTTDCPSQPDGAGPTSATIAGTGFAPRTIVELRLSGPGVERSLGSTEASADGSFRLRVDGLEGLVGNYQVLAAQPGSKNQASGSLEAPCPSVDLVVIPDCGLAGSPPERMALAVEGSGFFPGTSALVIFDGAGSHEVWPTVVLRDGTIAVSIAPFRRPDGRYTIRVRNEGLRQPLRIAVTRLTVPCPLQEAAITIQPECARPALLGDAERLLSIDVRGDGFRPGRVLVMFDVEEKANAQLFEAEADERGLIELTITPLPPPAGRYVIMASQIVGSSATRVESIGQIEASATFRSPCRDREPPPLVLEPDCAAAAPGIEGAYEITVRGRDFFRNGVALVTFGRREDAPEATALVAGDGTFTTTILVRGRPEGGYRMRAVQRDTALREVATARARFIVPCPVDPTIPIDPTISISPAYGPTSYTTLVEGRDFRPGLSVTLIWDRGIDAGRPFLVDIEPDGTFEIYLYILPNDIPGERRLTAGLPGDPDAFPGVSDEYVVVPGSGVPSGKDGDGFVSRR
ncbi:MAG: hypothetical protein ACC726_13325, partial [Chloroflexota bacterium]